MFNKPEHFGYDVDGIFIADFYSGISDPEFKTIELVNYLEMRTENLAPIFQPEGKFSLVTGRPSVDAPALERWVQDYFLPLPYQIHCSIGELVFSDFFIAEYKAKIILENNIQVFFESSIEQVEIINEILKEYTGTMEAVHWESFIKESIKGVRIQ